MKQLKQFILEGVKSNNFYKAIFPMFELEDPEDMDIDKDDEYWYDKNKAYKILKDFLKDAKSVKILTNDPDNELLKNVTVDIEKNDQFLKDKSYTQLPDNADWVGMDQYSLKVDGNKLYISSATGQSANSGDGIEACIIKNEKGKHTTSIKNEKGKRTSPKNESFYTNESKKYNKFYHKFVSLKVANEHSYIGIVIGTLKDDSIILGMVPDNNIYITNFYNDGIINIFINTDKNDINEFKKKFENGKFINKDDKQILQNVYNEIFK